MANSVPNEPPPPYSATPPPIGFQSPDPPPTVRVEVQQEGGYPTGQQQYPAAYPYAPGKPVPPGSTPVVMTQPQVVNHAVVILPPGTCPSCRAGILQSEYSMCGICLAILCFPIGVLCCVLMMERRCSNCHMSFDSI
ncbi:membrane protein BRI3-like [Macrobrachium nipponense]|uniref:membrane protein BRI3-like n=1 Tax=Macrobrachium nipponense TaxID=159736 RepID=UPI0030C80B72